MQAVVETVFDAAYLVTVITLGIVMIRESRGNKEYLLFGCMAVVLGLGDAFHLIPRAVALCTTGLEDYTVALGTGKWITSITMTIFYILLYYVWRRRYHIEGKKGLTVAIYALSAARILLCMCPENRWLSADAPLSWGIYRNLPFLAMGILVIVLFYKSAKEHRSTYVAYDRPEFRLLSAGGPMGGPSAHDRNAYDPENLRVCLDGSDRLQGDAQ